MRFSFRRVMVLILSIILVGLSSWFCGLFSGDSYSQLPVVNEPFLESIRVIDHETGMPVDDLWQMHAGTGQYLSLTLTPSVRIPEKWNSYPVQNPAVWATELWIWPGKNTRVKTGERWPIRVPVHVYAAASAVFKKGSRFVPPWEKPIVHCVNPNFYAEVPQYKGILRCRPNETPSHSKRSVFVALPKESPGEFIVEIRLYPMAYWRSAVRYEMGEDVVVWRSTLTVRPSISNGQ